MVIAKRARSSEQKSERREEILAAAAALLEKKPFPRIGIADIAEQAGMAKGTVFLYFKTKEELFFQIASREFVNWFDAMDRLFAELIASGKKPAKAGVVDALRRVLVQHPLLPRLSAILHIVLEQNIGYEEARDFKKTLMDRLGRTGTLLEQCLPSLRPGQGVKFLLWMYGLIIGFTHMAEPAPVLRKIYDQEPELRKIQIDFHEHFFDALETVLDGWKAQNRRRKRNSPSHQEGTHGKGSG